MSTHNAPAPRESKKEWLVLFVSKKGDVEAASGQMKDNTQMTYLDA